MRSIRTLTITSFLFVVALQLACAKEGGSGIESSSAATRASIVALPSSTAVVAGRHQITAFSPDGKQAWTFILPNNDTVAAPPAAALSSVTYVRGAQGLYAIAPDGKQLWQATHNGANDGVKGITPLADSTVAMTAGDNSLVGYNAQGQVKWTFTLPDGDKLTDAPVLAASSLVYVRSAKKLYAVDSQGNLAWQSELGEVDQ